MRRFDSTFMGIEAWIHLMRIAEEKKVTKLALNAQSSTEASRRNRAVSFAVGIKRLHTSFLTRRKGGPSVLSEHGGSSTILARIAASHLRSSNG